MQMRNSKNKINLVNMASRIGMLPLLIGLKRLILPQRLTILMYHRVLKDDEENQYGDVVVSATESEFMAQMRYLSESCDVVPLDEALQMLAMKKPSPRPTVAITFDDGYLDNYEVAYPILKEYSLPATIFLTTGFIGTSKIPWWDELGFYLKHTSNRRIRFNGEYINIMRDIPRAILRISDSMKVLSPARQEKEMRSIRKQCGIALPKRHLFMGWDHVRDMAGNGIAFGAHTVTHPILSMISRREVEREIVLSKEEIEKRIGKKVISFAYPNGSRKDIPIDVEKILDKNGIKTSVSTGYGTSNISTNRFRLLRSGINKNDTLAVFRTKIAGLGEGFARILGD